MGIIRPDSETGWMHADAAETDRILREGDGMAWPGDPSMYLSMGILTANRTGYSSQCNRFVRAGDIVARRYEVRRHNEDGEDVLIGSWRLEDFDRIIFDLAPLRLDSPGHIDALDAIDMHNAKVEKQKEDEYVDVMMQVLDHQMHLWHDLNNPRNVFRGIDGFRDKEKVQDTTQTIEAPVAD